LLHAKIQYPLLHFEQIHTILSPYNDNPLLHFDKSPRYCSLQLKDEYKRKNIRINPIAPNLEDRREFEKQISELLNFGLIQLSESDYSSPAFMVRMSGYMLKINVFSKV